MDNRSLVRYSTAQSEGRRTGLPAPDPPRQTMECAVSSECVVDRRRPYFLFRIHTGKVSSHLLPDRQIDDGTLQSLYSFHEWDWLTYNSFSFLFSSSSTSHAATIISSSSSELLLTRMVNLLLPDSIKGKWGATFILLTSQKRLFKSLVGKLFHIRFFLLILFHRIFISSALYETFFEESPLKTTSCFKTGF